MATDKPKVKIIIFFFIFVLRTLPATLKSFYLCMKRGTAMPRLNFEGRRKPECTTMLSLVHSFENFLRSQNYKICITLLLFLMSWKELPQSAYKDI